jgi:CDP-diacylglycerol--glycerol-3-phosphate 3-phosphatidyltransferase
VVSAILAHRWDHWQIGLVYIPVKWYAIAAVYFAVVISVISAVDYFIGFWKEIDHVSKDRRQAAVLSRGKSVKIT